jgi:hypothetical protein
MVNPWKSYFVQDNIVKDRAVFFGKTEFFKNVFRSTIFFLQKRFCEIGIIFICFQFFVICYCLYWKYL